MYWVEVVPWRDHWYVRSGGAFDGTYTRSRLATKEQREAVIKREMIPAGLEWEEYRADGVQPWFIEDEG
jgi:hypothetical protein